MMGEARAASLCFQKGPWLLVGTGRSQARVPERAPLGNWADKGPRGSPGSRGLLLSPGTQTCFWTSSACPPEGCRLAFRGPARLRPHWSFNNQKM